MPCCLPFRLRSSSYDPTRRESRWTSDPVLFRLRRTSADYNFTLDALALKPSGFCNVRVYSPLNGQYDASALSVYVQYPMHPQYPVHAPRSPLDVRWQKTWHPKQDHTRADASCNPFWLRLQATLCVLLTTISGFLQQSNLFPSSPYALSLYLDLAAFFQTTV